MINDADLFSLPLLFIFTKGANINGGHYTFTFMHLAGAFFQHDCVVFCVNFL